MNKKILIIEDEKAIQKILTEPLTFAGYQVTGVRVRKNNFAFFHWKIGQPVGRASVVSRGRY